MTATSVFNKLTRRAESNIYRFSADLSILFTVVATALVVLCGWSYSRSSVLLLSFVCTFIPAVPPPSGPDAHSCSFSAALPMPSGDLASGAPGHPQGEETIVAVAYQQPSLDRQPFIVAFLSPSIITSRCFPL
jgi:hypothetical protein